MGKNNLEDLGLDGRIILIRILNKCDEDGWMDGIDLARDRSRWRAGCKCGNDLWVV